MNKDFALFQEEFKRYQTLFGLSDWTIYFNYESLNNNFAEIEINLSAMVATVILNSDLPEKDKPHKDIKRTARHEAIHLLVGRLEQNARYRFASEDEIKESCEELVNKLGNLIP